MSNQIAITMYNGRVASVEAVDDIDVVIFNYGDVKQSAFKKKKFDLISIENHHVEGRGPEAMIGVNDNGF